MLRTGITGAVAGLAMLCVTAAPAHAIGDSQVKTGTKVSGPDGACGDDDNASNTNAGMNPDADDVPGLQVTNVQRLEGLVSDARLAICGRCRGCQHEQPTRRDDADPEGQMAGIDQMDGHIARFVIASVSCTPSSRARAQRRRSWSCVRMEPRRQSASAARATWQMVMNLWRPMRERRSERPR